MISGRGSFKLLLSSVLFVVGCIDAGGAGSPVDGGDGSPDASSIDPFVTGSGSGSASLPDLIVSSVGDPPSTAALGSNFSVSDTVTNQGTASAGASFTKYYLTTSGVSPQFLLGNRSVGAIAVGGMDSGTATATVPSGVPQGSYHVVACADSGPGTGGRSSQVAESNENNNCTASAGSVAITGADLTETAVSASPSSINTATGTLTVSETVKNIGNATAGASITRWYLSTDTVKDANDGFIRNCTNGGPIPGRNVAAVNAGASNVGSSSTSPLCIRDAAGLHAPVSGTYYVIACADDTNAVEELNETNNCTASSNTVTLISGPDLIESAVSSPTMSGASGSSFPITDTVENIGVEPAGSSFTKFYLSTNGTTLNIYLNTRSVGPLAANGGVDTATTTMTIPAGTAAGSYKVVACADSGPGTGGRTSQIAETNENNNCTASSGTITLGGEPDLVISAISAPPLLGHAGDTFGIVDTTANTGVADDTGAFFNKYYLSASTAPGSIVAYLATSSQNAPLPAGDNEQVTATAKIPSGVTPGTYFLLGCADAGPGTSGRTSQVPESNENNNCTASTTQIVIN